MSLIQELREAWPLHGDAATKAFALFKEWAPRSTRVPGCDTALRLAYRIYHGKTLEQAAAAEYLYRWHLAIDQLNNQSERPKHYGPRPNHLPAWNPSPLADHYAPHLLGQ